MLHLKCIKQEIEAEKLLFVRSWFVFVKFGKGCYRNIHIPKKKRWQN